MALNIIIMTALKPLQKKYTVQYGYEHHKFINGELSNIQ